MDHDGSLKLVLCSQECFSSAGVVVRVWHSLATRPALALEEAVG